MNWAAIEAIGAMLGAIAVLATLGYLAVQIKQSNRNDENESRQTILSGFFDKAYRIAEDKEIRTLMRKAYIDFEVLSDDDKTAFDMFQMWFWGNLHSALILRENDLLDEESFEIIKGAFIGSVNTPGGRQWWQAAKNAPNMSRSVVRFVESELPDFSSSWLDLQHMGEADGGVGKE
ncbi:MAG: hypothetical protein AB8B81_21680 [Halioglobus sp.]